MKADKKEPFQGAPKGGPWSYTRRTREEVQKEMCDMFEGLKIRCGATFRPGTEKHDTDVWTHR